MGLDVDPSRLPKGWQLGPVDGVNFMEADATTVSLPDLNSASTIVIGNFPWKQIVPIHKNFVDKCSATFSLEPPPSQRVKESLESLPFHLESMDDGVVATFTAPNGTTTKQDVRMIHRSQPGFYTICGKDQKTFAPDFAIKRWTSRNALGAVVEQKEAMQMYANYISIK